MPDCCSRHSQSCCSMQVPLQVFRTRDWSRYFEGRGKGREKESSKLKLSHLSLTSPIKQPIYFPSEWDPLISLPMCKSLFSSCWLVVFTCGLWAQGNCLLGVITSHECHTEISRSTPFLLKRHSLCKTPALKNMYGGDVMASGCPGQTDGAACLQSPSLVLWRRMSCLSIPLKISKSVKGQFRHKVWTPWTPTLLPNPAPNQGLSLAQPMNFGEMLKIK